jgi:hypothetical protein
MVRFAAGYRTNLARLPVVSEVRREGDFVGQLRGSANAARRMRGDAGASGGKGPDGGMRPKRSDSVCSRLSSGLQAGVGIATVERQYARALRKKRWDVEQKSGMVVGDGWRWKGSANGGLVN